MGDPRVTQGFFLVLDNTRQRVGLMRDPPIRQAMESAGYDVSASALKPPVLLLLRLPRDSPIHRPAAFPKVPWKATAMPRVGECGVHLTPLGSTLAQRRCPRTQLDVVMTVLAGKAISELVMSVSWGEGHA